MTKKIILFNGPPRCGKDTAANTVLKYRFNETFQYKMAYPLKQACHTLLGLQGSLEDLEYLKELPLKFENPDDLTLRQFYIHISENVSKPLFGNDIFGRLAIEYLTQTDKKIITISDCGFADEIEPIMNHFNHDDIVLVKITRPTTSFAGDSRSHISLPLQTIDLVNDDSIEAFEGKILTILEKLGV